MTLDEARANVGNWVVYTPFGGDREDGTITAVGARFVFVRYAGDAGSKATDPSTLTLLAAAHVNYARRDHR